MSGCSGLGALATPALRLYNLDDLAVVAERNRLGEPSGRLEAASSLRVETPNLDRPAFFAEWQLISQGAEAKVFETDFAGRACIVKERVKKSYRLPVLDKKLSHRRLVQEARCILKCRRAGVLTPVIFLVDEDNSRLYLEKIEGGSLKDYLRRAYKLGIVAINAVALYRSTESDGASQVWDKALKKAYHIGEAIAKMHDADIVHGDLTTSNMMLSSDDATVVREEWTMIDFGLANSQPLPEDKAVDLYVMERAFASTHVNSEVLVEEVLRAYRAKSRRSDAIFQKLSQVRLRGRKRTMVG
ncbi:Serine/threonine-protein kinase Bud32 [Phytophthora cactorum]|nr:Serine/threonine-protein kinase Bud32 [Phytophthora cactorum]